MPNKDIFVLLCCDQVYCDHTGFPVYAFHYVFVASCAHSHLTALRSSIGQLQDVWELWVSHTQLHTVCYDHSSLTERDSKLETQGRGRHGCRYTADLTCSLALFASAQVVGANSVCLVKAPSMRDVRATIGNSDWEITCWWWWSTHFAICFSITSGPPLWSGTPAAGPESFAVWRGGSEAVIAGKVDMRAKSSPIPLLEADLCIMSPARWSPDAAASASGFASCTVCSW